MRRVLVIAYYFPPLGGIGSVRAAAFAAQLGEHGWEPAVLAPSNGAYHRDPSLAVDESRVARCRALELSRAGKRLLRAGGDDTRPADVAGPRAALRAGARALAYFPDGQVGWYPGAVLAGRRELRRQRFDAIFSSSSPITAHLVARRLCRESGLPWVAELRDPWSATLDGVAGRRAARLERALAREATRVVMTSPSWAAQHAARWGRPVDVVLNGHAIERPCAAATDAGGGFTLGYLGSLYPALQDLDAAWSAIRRLAEDGDPVVDRLLLVGAADPALSAQLAAQRLDGLVERTGFLPHAAGIERLCEASALLLAGPREASPRLRGMIPAKLFEYLATGLPILYVGDPGADAAALLREQPGCHICAPHDVDAVAAVLRACRAAGGQRVARDVTRLTRWARTAELAALLDAAAAPAPAAAPLAVAL